MNNEKTETVTSNKAESPNGRPEETSKESGVSENGVGRASNARSSAASPKGAASQANISVASVSALLNANDGETSLSDVARPNRRRKRPESGSDDESRKVVKVAPEDVASHYNARPDQGKEYRRHSVIKHLRSFNNWVKAVLINSYTPREATVLDMGCGKGGDLLKWDKAKARRVVMVDIAEKSVEQAQTRYQQMRRPLFEAEFHAVDCFNEDLVVNTETPFDLVSLQFCMHYAFSGLAQVRQMLRNVTKNLKPGGHFIATIPDSTQIINRIRKADGLEFGNSVYKIRFADKSNIQKVGQVYDFLLEDAVDCPEYLVHWPTFMQIAHDEFNLSLVEKMPFHEFHQKKMTDRRWGALYDRFRVVRRPGDKIPADEWEAIGLYLAFALKKMR